MIPRIFKSLYIYLSGTPDSEKEWQVSTYFFLKGFSFIALLAFISLWQQSELLFGLNGINPYDEFLDSIQRQYIDRNFVLAPTLLWFFQAENTLNSLFVIGSLSCVIAFTGYIRPIAFFVAWLCYLSACAVGNPFTQFPIDKLPLELLFAAIFLSPWHLNKTYAKTFQSTRIARWLIYWIFFRLIFENALSRIGINDPSWYPGFYAVYNNYLTQPLPVWTSLFLHKGPYVIHNILTLAIFLIQIIAPFFIIASRRWRQIAVVLIALVEIYFRIIGNEGVFRWLSLLLCIYIIGDDFWLYKKAKTFIAKTNKPTKEVKPRQEEHSVNRISRVMITAVFSLLALFIGLLNFTVLFNHNIRFPELLNKPLKRVLALKTTNSYANLRLTKLVNQKISIQGSIDGKEWREFPLQWNNREVYSRPKFLFYHFPRLEAKSTELPMGFWHNNQWFLKYLQKIVDRNPTVMNSFAINPFPAEQPNFIRSILYEYNFSDIRTMKTTGYWWQRRAIGPYTPPIPRTVEHRNGLIKNNL